MNSEQSTFERLKSCINCTKAQLKLQLPCYSRSTKTTAGRNLVLVTFVRWAPTLSLCWMGIAGLIQVREVDWSGEALHTITLPLSSVVGRLIFRARNLRILGAYITRLAKQYVRLPCLFVSLVEGASRGFCSMACLDVRRPENIFLRHCTVMSGRAAETI